MNEGSRIIAEALPGKEDKAAFRQNLLAALWSRRDSTISLNDWLRGLCDDLLNDLFAKVRTAADERATLDTFIDRTAADGDAAELTLGLFSGHGEGNDRINLSTLHSAKGREFSIVVLFGIDEGQLPRNDARPTGIREARRLFYIGFTRAKGEVHVMYSAARPSPFVTEVRQRLEHDE